MNMYNNTYCAKFPIEVISEVVIRDSQSLICREYIPAISVNQCFVQQEKEQQGFLLNPSMKCKTLQPAILNISIRNRIRR